MRKAKEINGYPSYFVDKEGDVYRLQKLTPRPTRGDYLRCAIVSFAKKRKDYLIHRLVAEAFIDNPNNLPEVNHKDSDRSNNRKENLEWCTRKENMIHAYSEGKKIPPNGERNGRSTLTLDQVKDIRFQYSTGGYTYIELANKFHSKKSTISNIIKLNTWK